MRLFYILLILCTLLLSCKSTKIENLYFEGQVIDYLIVLDDDVNLRGKEIGISKKIDFQGSGCIYNGTIFGKGAKIVGDPCFASVVLKGTWSNQNIKLGWFVTGDDPIENYKQLCNLIDLGIQVLIDKKYKIADPTPSSSHHSRGNLLLKGMSKKTCGLELTTVHEPYKSYFDLSDGRNISIENLHLTTGSKTLSKETYTLIYSDLRSCNQVIQEKVNLSKNIIEGNIKIVINPKPIHPKFYDFKYRKISVIDNVFLNTVNVLSYSNIGYDSLLIKENIFKNLYGPTLSFGIFGKDINGLKLYQNRKHAKFTENKVFNEKPIIPINKTYVAPLVAKGRDFRVIGNNISNLLSLTPVSTYSFYTSTSDYLLVRDNNISNCGSIAGSGVKGKSCLLKLKGSRNVLIDNNKFSFNENAYKALSKGDKKINICLWDSWNSGLDTISVLKFKGNVFKSWTLSETSRIFSSTVEFLDNTITVENLIFNKEAPNSLLYIRGKMAKGDFKLVRNTININKSKQPFYILKSNVNNKEFESFVFQNNTFKTPNTPLLQIPRSKNIKLDFSDRRNSKINIEFIDPQNRKAYK